MSLSICISKDTNKNTNNLITHLFSIKYIVHKCKSSWNWSVRLMGKKLYVMENLTDFEVYKDNFSV
jgi:hypothetical protein